MNPFDRMARFYDTMYSHRFSTKMVDYTLQILDKNNYSPETVLDVCCGTGTALQRFAEKGLKIEGLDRSGGMLKVARKKLKGRKARLYQQSLPRISIPARNGSSSRSVKQYDLVTSYFDSLNFLVTERDLKAGFRGIFNHVRPGGWFVFDMNTLAMFEPLWNEHPWVGVRDDMTWIMRSEFLKKKSMTRLFSTFYEKVGKTWRRYDETHLERAYPNGTVKRLLREVGFQIKGFYHVGTFDPVRRDSKKFCAAARRPVK